MLLPFFVSQFRPVFNPTRLPIIVVPGACILLALLLRQTAFQVITIVVLLGLAFTPIRDAVMSIVTYTDQTPKASFQELLRVAQCGDTLILPEMIISETEYYLRRLNAPECLRRETFPLSAAKHPGWFDNDELLAHTDLLTEEASNTASRLANRSGNAVYLFWPRNPGSQRVTEFLKAAFDRSLLPKQALDLAGHRFDGVQVYITK
jgi:hypothetical protein